jgi:hypothetical protein
MESTPAETIGKPFILFPLSSDILLGRGRPIQNHEGNIRFRLVMESYAVEYQKAKRDKKKEIAHDVVDKMKSKGCRFLQQKTNTDIWQEVEDEAAKQKVMHSFRDLRALKSSRASGLKPPKRTFEPTDDVTGKRSQVTK